MDKTEEIKNHLAGFNAAVQSKIQHYRGKRDALNQVPQFVEAIEGERARMMTKLNSMATSEDYRAVGHEIEDLRHQVNMISDSEIARAQSSNTVEFDQLTAAIRDTGRSINAAVGKLETKGMKK